MTKRSVRTKWGDRSLIYAEGELYDEALEDKNNTVFVLLSETHIPIKSFDEAYEELMTRCSKKICLL